MTAFSLALAARLGAIALALLAATSTQVFGQPSHNPQVEQLHVQGRLIGRDLYDRTGQKIGTIRNLLKAPNGVIEAVLVEVGGYLGLGDKTIAVPATQLESKNNQLGAADLTRHGAEELPSYGR